ncbi:DUF222 domain-containing protein [Nocardia sp. GAS34]|uniref:DUF222 domain-containing protein n=1 Tax=unclassified Nocardia TaxID=2637762 RepID=UPI003D256886
MSAISSWPRPSAQQPPHSRELVVFGGGGEFGGHRTDPAAGGGRRRFRHRSSTTARGYVEAAALLLRMPILGGSVARGEIDYANLRMTTTVFGDDASPRTLSLLEEQVACAAAEFTPSALRAQLWKLWLAADPDEAAEARRRRASTDRRAYIRRGGHGLSWLIACVTDAEGSQADALLCEITATVCSNDPRSKSALRADGLMALLHGEAALVCGCGQADCPKGTQPAPSRRKPLVEVVVDAETLLGLADNPATLPDGTPVDAEVARVLAQDATWRAIITDTRDALARSTIAGQGVDETASNAASSGVGNADPKRVSCPARNGRHGACGGSGIGNLLCNNWN